MTRVKSRQKVHQVHCTNALTSQVDCAKSTVNIKLLFSPTSNGCFQERNGPTLAPIKLNRARPGANCGCFLLATRWWVDYEPSTRWKNLFFAANRCFFVSGLLSLLCPFLHRFFFRFCGTSAVFPLEIFIFLKHSKLSPHGCSAEVGVAGARSRRNEHKMAPVVCLKIIPWKHNQNMLDCECQ